MRASCRYLPSKVFSKPSTRHAQLLAGGLNAIELTLRTPASLDALAALKQQFPDLTIGAGTVLDATQVDAVCAVGVDFIITPGVSPALLDVLLAAGVPVIPGAATPSELMALDASGFRVAKLFPATVVGESACSRRSRVRAAQKCVHRRHRRRKRSGLSGTTECDLHRRLVDGAAGMVAGRCLRQDHRECGTRGGHRCRRA